MTPDFSATTIQAAQANTLIAVSIQVSDFNKQLKDGYLSLFNDWSINVVAGRIPNTDPPKPPKAYVIGYFTDQTTGPDVDGAFRYNVQWPYPMIGKDPVCAMPPIPVPVTHTSGADRIGNEDPTSPGWFSSLAGDTTPRGMKVVGTSADGKFGAFLKWASAVQSPNGEVLGWYQKIG